jgi:hypothetical protein
MTMTHFLRIAAANLAPMLGLYDVSTAATTIATKAMKSSAAASCCPEGFNLHRIANLKPYGFAGRKLAPFAIDGDDCGVVGVVRLDLHSNQLSNAAPPAATP